MLLFYHFYYNFYSNGSGALARNLFKGLFTTEELKTHSLNGKKCPALGDDQIILPKLDPQRKKAIFGEISNTYINCLNSSNSQSNLNLQTL